ncbi:MAG: hypothetical protein AAFU41_09665 [Pseudomonadota bacterium]
MSNLWDKLVSLRERTHLRLFLGATDEPSDDEIAYFAAHPDQIDEFSEPMRLHRLFLWFAVISGVIIVGLAKFLGGVEEAAFFNGIWREYVVDIVFEAGVALIGAGVTAYFMGILLNNQQEKTKRWRKHLRAAIARKNRETGGRS